MFIKNYVFLIISTSNQKITWSKVPIYCEYFGIGYIQYVEKNGLDWFSFIMNLLTFLLWFWFILKKSHVFRQTFFASKNICLMLGIAYVKVKIYHTHIYRMICNISSLFFANNIFLNYILQWKLKSCPPWGP